MTKSQRCNCSAFQFGVGLNGLISHNQVSYFNSLKIMIKFPNVNGKDNIDEIKTGIIRSLLVKNVSGMTICMTAYM